MQKIYWLSTNVRFDDQLRYASSMRLQTQLCPRDSSHAILSRWTRPLKLLGQVQPMTDFEWTIYGDVIVSKSIVESFRKAGFSGIEFSPVEFYSSTETPFGRESLELRVNGWGGQALSESGVRVIEECSYCKRQIFSEYTDPEKLLNWEAWDGSDVFVIWPLPRFIMVTGRVRDFILDFKYTGVRLRNLRVLPHDIAGTLTPGNLRDWFDENRLQMLQRDCSDECD